MRTGELQALQAAEIDLAALKAVWNTSPPITTRDGPVVESVAWMPSIGGIRAMTEVRTRLIRRR